MGPRYTYDDYMRLPDGERYEVIEGELLLTPVPSFRHQRILSHLHFRLYAFVEAPGLGMVVPAPTDVILDAENVVQPDLLFVAKERLAIIDTTGGVHGAPDLVVEILSPSTVGRDQGVKRALYSRYGVRECWFVDPDTQSIEVLTLGQSGLVTWRHFTHGSILTSVVLPNLSFAVAEIFTA